MIALQIALHALRAEHAAIEGNSSQGSKPMTWLSRTFELNATLLAAEAAVSFHQPFGWLA